MTGFYSSGSGGGAQTQLDALKALANSGKLQIWTDAAPKDPDTAFAGTKLAEFTFAATAFGADSVSGSFSSKTVTCTASFSASTVTALASGTAASFAVTNGAGTTIYATGSVGTSGADLNFSSTSFTSGANVTLSSFTLTMPE